MTAETLLSMEQFLALPERAADGSLYELSKGELIKLPPPNYRHAVITAKITSILMSALSPEEYIIAAGDAGFLLDPNPKAATVRGADVAVNRKETVGKDLPHGWFPGAPLLAVEVVSLGNSAKDMQLKVTQYLSAGGLEVWLVYPDTRSIAVYSAGRENPQLYAGNDEFTSAVGATFRVADFFTY